MKTDDRALILIRLLGCLESLGVTELPKHWVGIQPFINEVQILAYTYQ